MEITQTMIGMPCNRLRMPESGRTLPLMRVPLEAAIKRAELRRRLEVGEKIRLIEGAAADPPKTDEEKRVVNGAVSWVGRNYYMMRRKERNEALWAVAHIAIMGPTYVDPVEAGATMRALGIGQNWIANFGRRVIYAIRTDDELDGGPLTVSYYCKMGLTFNVKVACLWDAKKPIGTYYELLGAALGDRVSLRFALFHAERAREADGNTERGKLIKWIYGGILPHMEKLERYQSALIGELRAEQEKVRAAVPSYEQVVAELKAKKDSGGVDGGAGNVQNAA